MLHRFFEEKRELILRFFFCLKLVILVRKYRTIDNKNVSILII